MVDGGITGLSSGASHPDKMDQKPGHDEDIDHFGNAVPDGEGTARSFLLFLRAAEVSGLTKVLHVGLQPKIADKTEAKQGGDQVGFKRRHGTAEIKFFGEEMEKRDKPADALHCEEAFKERLCDRARIIRIRGGFAEKCMKLV